MSSKSSESEVSSKSSESEVSSKSSESDISSGTSKSEISSISFQSISPEGVLEVSGSSSVWFLLNSSIDSPKPCNSFNKT